VLYGISLTEDAQLYQIDVTTGVVTTAPVAVDVVYTATDPSGRTLTMDVHRVKDRAK